MILRDRYREPAEAVVSLDGVAVTNREVLFVCLDALVGSELSSIGLRVKAIVSRLIGDVPYRYHIYELPADAEQRLVRDLSLWMDGYLDGRESARTRPGAR